MRLPNFKSENGSATIDFIAFGLLAAFGILFASQQLTDLQHRQFVVQQFSKQIARSLVLKSGDPDNLVRSLANSYGLAVSDLTYSVNCLPQCQDLQAIEPGAVIEVRVQLQDSTSVIRMRATR